MTPTTALISFLSTLPSVSSTSAGVFMTAAPSVADLGTDAPAVVVGLVSAPPVTQSFTHATPRRYTYDVGVTGFANQVSTTTSIATAIHDAVHDVQWDADGWVISESLVIDLIEDSPRDPDSEVTYYNLAVRLRFDGCPA